MKKKAFTLAEVLITLAIIGVVAALTLPTMIANHQKKVYVVQLQKAISTLEQGFKMMMADDAVDKLEYTSVFSQLSCLEDETNGCAFSDAAGTRVMDEEIMPFMNAWKKYFNISQIGQISGSYEYCYMNTNSSCDDFSDLGYYFWQFADGMYVSFWSLFKVDTNYYGDLFIDVNGLKGPNIWGRDLFWFYIKQDGTLKGIGDGTKEKCVSGASCSSYLMNNGWVMDY